MSREQLDEVAADLVIQERRQDVLNKKIAMCELELEKSVKERVQVKYLMQQ